MNCRNCTAAITQFDLTTSLRSFEAHGYSKKEAEAFWREHGIDCYYCDRARSEHNAYIDSVSAERHPI